MHSNRLNGCEEVSSVNINTCKCSSSHSSEPTYPIVAMIERCNMSHRCFAYRSFALSLQIVRLCEQTTGAVCSEYTEQIDCTVKRIKVC
jgi:hypothetical protein